MDRGAHFHRCDLQVHTPRDANWSGIRPTTPDERREFAERFVRHCRAEEIDAVAITDHHDFAFFDYIRAAAEAETDAAGELLPPAEQLTVFPGLELTLAVPCQAILILDANFPSERLVTVLEILSVDVTDEALPSLPSTVRLDHIHSLKQLHELLDNNSWLRGAYTVLPNVTDGGHGTLMRNGMQAKYKEMPCVGGYLDGSVAKIGQGNRTKFAGADPAWGNKPLAIFQTSDARDDTLTGIGTHSTWIKWATPTAEALRQACLAKESRISHVDPALPQMVITRLSVSNSHFMGPIELELNPQYNAIIGGRGTGKSTILEYIRWALCDEHSGDVAVDGQPSHEIRRQKLIDGTLAAIDAQVDVHFLINGIPHVVRRYARSGDAVLKVGDGEFESAHPSDIRALLPIEAYSQRQLSSVSVRIDELTRFVTAPIRPSLNDIEARVGRLAAETRTNHATLNRYRSLARSLATDAVTVASLATQATNLRNSLGGVSDEDRILVGQKSTFDHADELVRSWLRRLDQARIAASEFHSTLHRLAGEPREQSDGHSWSATADALEDAIRSVLVELGGLGERAEALVVDATTSSSAITALSAQWDAIGAKFESDYAAAKERSSAHKSKLDALADLEKRRRALQDSIDRRKDELSQIGDPVGEYVGLRDAWRNLQQERSGLIEQQCSKLTELSGGLIRASLRRGAGLAALAEKFRGAVVGSGVRTVKLDAFFSQLMNAEHPLVEWDQVLDELEGLVAKRDDPDSNITELDAPVLSRSFHLTELIKIAGKMSPEALLGLALTTPEDVPSFEYRTKDGEYIQFAVASAGQQATALLRVLLNQPGPPLVIDQPEDDLDSQVVNDVVSQIWNAKTVRQLIFSSHNANLVVNGDAELVVCCDYRAAGDQSGGRLKIEGAIDIPEVRNEITVVMEGGERAFRLRKEKYGF